MTYEVIFAGQGSGYLLGEIIFVPDDRLTIDEVSYWINKFSPSLYTELHLIGGNMNEMSFCKRMANENFGKILTIKNTETNGNICT